jgi:hypothetical protein
MPFLNPVRFTQAHALHLAVACVSVVSCSTALEKNTYIQWVENYDNGLHVRKVAGEFIFDVQYQPSQYILLQQNKDSYEVASDTTRNDLEHLLLTISTRDKKSDFIDYGITDISAKQRKLYYFSYLFQNDIHLEQNGINYPCVLFHFERQEDLKLSRTFVLAFEKPKMESEELSLIINTEQFGSFPIKIRILKMNIPTLKS